MNVSLTEELNNYVASQMETGHYASVSEVIREALRDKIKSAATKELDSRIASGRHQIENGEFYIADGSYFDKAREYLEKRQPAKTI